MSLLGIASRTWNIITNFLPDWSLHCIREHTLVSSACTVPSMRMNFLWWCLGIAKARGGTFCMWQILKLKCQPLKGLCFPYTECFIKPSACLKWLQHMVLFPSPICAANRRHMDPVKDTVSALTLDLLAAVSRSLILSSCVCVLIISFSCPAGRVFQHLKLLSLIFVLRNKVIKQDTI